MFIDPTSQVSFKSQPNQVSSKIVGSMPLLRWYAWCRWRCSAPAAQPTTGVATAPKEWETVPANPQVYGRDQQTCYQNHGILSCKILYVYNCSEDLGTRARTIHMFVLCLNTSPGVEGKYEAIDEVSRSTAQKAFLACIWSPYFSENILQNAIAFRFPGSYYINSFWSPQKKLAFNSCFAAQVCPEVDSAGGCFGEQTGPHQWGLFIWRCWGLYWWAPCMANTFTVGGYVLPCKG